MEDIKHILGASILAGFCLLLGGTAIFLAVRSLLSERTKAWVNGRLPQRFDFQDLSKTVKENSLLLMVLVVLVYPLGDATLHVLDDIFEDALRASNFERDGDACRQTNPACRRLALTGYGDLSLKVKDERDVILGHMYHNLDEGSNKLKFTRIGEIEAREDQVDRETIDKEKSYLQVLQIGLLLLSMLSLALVIYTSRALVPRAVFLTVAVAGSVFLSRSGDLDAEPAAAVVVVGSALLVHAGWSLYRWARRRRGGERGAAAVGEGDAAPPPSWKASVKGRLENPAVWKPILAGALLALSLGVVAEIFKEYEEQEDKYERLVFHVWKNHLDEKLAAKKNEEDRPGIPAVHP